MKPRAITVLFDFGHVGLWNCEGYWRLQDTIKMYLYSCKASSSERSCTPNEGQDEYHKHIRAPSGKRSVCKRMSCSGVLFEQSLGIQKQKNPKPMAPLSEYPIMNYSSCLLVNKHFSMSFRVLTLVYDSHTV